jgi:hypothetical protein
VFEWNHMSFYTSMIHISMVTEKDNFEGARI